MKNVHRLSLMVLTVLTAAFLAVDLPLMAQMGGQQQGRGQQGAPQQQKGAPQGAPRGAGTAQIDKSSPKLSPQQEQRVKQLQQQAQSLFRNLKQVLGELQRLPKPGTQGLAIPGVPAELGQGTNPNVQRRGNAVSGDWINNASTQGERPGPQPGTRGLAESDDPDGATSNPSGGVVDGDRLAQTGRNDAAFIKFDGLKQQAQQIVNNFEDIGEELSGFGCQRYNACVAEGTSTAMQLPPGQLQKIVGELGALGLNYSFEAKGGISWLNFF